LPLQSDLPRLPAAIQRHLQAAWRGGREGCHPHAAASHAAAQRIGGIQLHLQPSTPGFLQPQGARPGPLQPQIQIGSQPPQRPAHPPLGFDQAIEGGAKQGIEASQRVGGEGDLSLQITRHQPLTRPHRQREGGSGMQLFRLKAAHGQKAVAPFELCPPWPQQAMALLARGHRQPGGGPATTHVEAAPEGPFLEPRRQRGAARKIGKGKIPIASQLQAGSQPPPGRQPGAAPLGREPHPLQAASADAPLQPPFQGQGANAEGCGRSGRGEQPQLAALQIPVDAPAPAAHTPFTAGQGDLPSLAAQRGPGQLELGCRGLQLPGQPLTHQGPLATGLALFQAQRHLAAAHATHLTGQRQELDQRCHLPAGGQEIRAPALGLPVATAEESGHPGLAGALGLGTPVDGLFQRRTRAGCSKRKVRWRRGG
jgi:hypothetical protein